MACRLAIALLLAANVHEPRRIHTCKFTSGAKTPSPRLLLHKRAAEATVPINDKMIVLGLQAHNHWGGLISYFNADRGGQAYAYKPELP